MCVLGGGTGKTKVIYRKSLYKVLGNGPERGCGPRWAKSLDRARRSTSTRDSLNFKN
eukprot:SAG31_NODE_438_length_15693_cov_6.254248_11_plen_57_part_00